MFDDDDAFVVMSLVALLLLLFVFLQLSLMLPLPLLLLKKKFSLPLLLNTGDNDDDDDDDDDANRVLQMLRGVVIGASAARVVVDTVAVVDVDDLDRSLPSIACVIFCTAQTAGRSEKQKKSKTLSLCSRPPPHKKRYNTLFSTLFARTKEKQLIRSLFFSLSLPLSGACVFVSSLLLFVCVFIIIERRECRAEEAKMLRT